MSIREQENGFYEWHDQPNVIPSLGFQSARMAECIAHYHTAGFRGLFGNPHFGFEQDNLDFLREVKNATYVWLWDIELTDIDAIYDLTELDYVGINPNRPGIDFSRFPKLRYAVNHWNKSDLGITESTITKFDHWHFKPRLKSFEGITIPAGVEELQLFMANPISLEGLPVMPKLRELQIHRCRNLVDMTVLPEIAPNLEKLLSSESPRIQVTTGIQDHPTLTTAWVGGRESLLRSQTLRDG
ncbi:MAG: hypothetical protein ACI9G1_004989 [Pirellulaceae bacterium]|jgi:hypothetical protein